MNVRDLLDVKVICESGSLRKAALVLGVTQPTLSNRIAHLEDQLGSRLFDRSRGQSRPTDLALFIAGRSDAISVEASRLVQDIRRVAATEIDDPRGFTLRSLRLGVAGGIGKFAA